MVHFNQPRIKLPKSVEKLIEGKITKKVMKKVGKMRGRPKSKVTSAVVVGGKLRLRISSGRKVRVGNKSIRMD